MSARSGAQQQERMPVLDISKDRNGVYFDGDDQWSRPGILSRSSVPFAFDKNWRYEYGRRITSVVRSGPKQKKAFDEAYRKWKAKNERSL